MPVITDIYAREILDSRGNPTVEVEVVLDDGKKIKVEKMIGFAERVHNKW